MTREWDAEAKRWVIKTSSDVVAGVILIMTTLSDDERLEVMDAFCKACGSADPGCVCLKDE